MILNQRYGASKKRWCAYQDFAGGLAIIDGTTYTLHNDIDRLLSAVVLSDFDYDIIKPLLNAALAESPSDASIWEIVSSVVVELTAPPRIITSSLQRTPWNHKTSSFVNSSEFRRDVDRVLRFELGPLHVGLPEFFEAFFGSVPGLLAASVDNFRKCSEGNDPLFEDKGWACWPADAKESDVFSWFGTWMPKLTAFAEDFCSTSTKQRKLLVQPKTPLQGSTGKRSMGIGFVDHNSLHPTTSRQEFKYRWSRSHIIGPGELKNNPAADQATMAWFDLATYAREILAAQDNRRFVLGFTLCGSLMRVWEFDRLGGIASEEVDINKDGGLQFVTAIIAQHGVSEFYQPLIPSLNMLRDKAFPNGKRGTTEDPSLYLGMKEVLRAARERQDPDS